MNSFPYIGFSLVFFPGSLGPLGFILILGFHLSSLLVSPFSLSARLLPWLFSFWYHLPPPLPPAIGGTCSPSFTSPLLLVLQFIFTVRYFCFVLFLLFYMTYCSFASCSLFCLCSWVLRYPRFPLSIYVSAF